MSVPPSLNANGNLRWYQGVPRYAWMVLIIAALGWLFDTMDGNLFTLVRQQSVQDLLLPQFPDVPRLRQEVDRYTANPPQTDTEKAALESLIKQRDDAVTQYNSRVAEVGGWITAIFLIGWATGGFIFGIIGDRLGRTRTMIITILIYACFTGFSGLVHSWELYALARFCTGLGVGGEFAAGAALVAEIWPERSRAMALGTLQALSAVGNIMAAVITYTMAQMHMQWRAVYFVGVVPAFLVVWIRASVREPERWQHAKEEAKKDSVKQKMGSIVDLFAEPHLRRNTIAGVLLALAGVGGLWGVGFFLPDLIGHVLKKTVTHLSPVEQTLALQKLRSIVFIVQQVGAFIGMYAYAILSERTGRRPALAFFFIMALVVVQGTFWGVHDLTSGLIWAFFLGIGALAPFSAYTVYFPELYPTRVRATGIGFCYNCARFLAAFAPFMLGGLSKYFADPADETAGLRIAASIVASIYLVGFVGLWLAPETKGKPLPE